MADEQLPSEDELREALGRIGVADILLSSASTLASIGFQRVSGEARDLAQARLAIEALRALEPVLREGGVDEAVVRDLEQARANLQLAYASAVAEPASSASSSERDVAAYTAMPQTEEELAGVEEATKRMVEEEPF